MRVGKEQGSGIGLRRWGIRRWHNFGDSAPIQIIGITIAEFAEVLPAKQKQQAKQHKRKTEEPPTKATQQSSSSAGYMWEADTAEGERMQLARSP